MKYSLKRRIKNYMTAKLIKWCDAIPRDVWEKSDKVIYGCVIYTKLPINISANYTTFISCEFQSLKYRVGDDELDKILGIAHKPHDCHYTKDG